MKHNKRKNRRSNSSAFTLTELMVTVAIIGVITAAAFPKYLQQIQKARQSDTTNQISQILTTIQAYREEFLEDPSGWNDLARITPVKQERGIAKGSSYSTISSPNGGHYSIQVQKGSKSKPFAITAHPKQRKQTGWGIKACINTETGVAEVRRQVPGSSVPNTICS